MQADFLRICKMRSNSCDNKIRLGEPKAEEYRPSEMISDNYPKYLMTMDSLLQKRNGIDHVNLADFMMEGKHFE